MNLSNLMTARERQHLNALNIDKADCLARFQRCNTKLKQCNRDGIKQWLARLPEVEREQCRTVLNGLVKQRAAARQE
ncbi:hypothetical protein CXF86_11040 [Shewanella sp. GutCb]|uniref:hypothetical protein n=1 Tax=Shewanella sp. GutCb TaxID=2058315 RepID=UPI000C7BDBC1|nr:hypothetical protein [Shewanella sp. GutCb]PKG74818.1 hypothetical protein CXF86_11040 [Shewanella sp. GutCb]